MNEDSAQTGHAEAKTMLDIFASVGSTHFDVTWTTLAGTKEYFRRGVNLAELYGTMPAMLASAPSKQRNIIVRPHSPEATFIQLDDLNTSNLTRLAPAVFLVLETSPANFQAWIALPGAEDKDFVRRLRKGTGADPTASGATRVAGSWNFKDKYAPVFPRVALRHANPSRMTSIAELESLGLVAELEKLPPLRVTPTRARSFLGRKWPSYAMCLDGAPLNSEETGPDTSRADIVWCMTAISWGFGVDETAMRLMDEPASKASTRGKKYADDTVRKAALYVQQRRQQPKRERTAEHG